MSKITHSYKDIELEDYTSSEQPKLDQKIVKAQLTGDYSELIETETTDV